MGSDRAGSKAGRAKINAATFRPADAAMQPYRRGGSLSGHTEMNRVNSFEIGVSLLIILVCSVVIFESLGLPPGSFEPLGSAPVPQATCGLIILLCLLVIYGAVRRKNQPAEPGTSEIPNDVTSALLLVVVTLAYVVALHFRLTGFGILTAAYLFLVISALERFRAPPMAIAAILGLLVGFGVEYLFTQFFVVDLPAA